MDTMPREQQTANSEPIVPTVDTVQTNEGLLSRLGRNRLIALGLSATVAATAVYVLTREGADSISIGPEQGVEAVDGDDTFVEDVLREAESNDELERQQLAAESFTTRVRELGFEQTEISIPGTDSTFSFWKSEDTLYHSDFSSMYFPAKAGGMQEESYFVSKITDNESEAVAILFAGPEESLQEMIQNAGVLVGLEALSTEDIDTANLSPEEVRELGSDIAQNNLGYNASILGSGWSDIGEQTITGPVQGHESPSAPGTITGIIVVNPRVVAGSLETVSVDDVSNILEEQQEAIRGE